MQYETIDMGALYRLSGATRLGVMFKNMVGFSFKEEYSGFSLPKTITLGISRTVGMTLLSLDSEYIYGNFGGYEKQAAEIWFLRGGIEHRLTRHIRVRAGLVYPAIAKTSTSGNLKDEFPSPGIGGSLGVGLALKRFDINLALYGDPAKSYVAQSPNLGATGTLTFKF